MKQIEEIRSELEYGNIYTLEEFRKHVKSGFFIPDDGSGCFHDGLNETNISVWSVNIFDTKWDKYPYVCWYNK